MHIESVRTVVFSPTGTSKKIADAIAQGVAATLARPDTAEGISPAGASAEPGAAPNDPAAVVKRIDLTHAAAEATLPADAVAVIVAPVYGGHPAPTAVRRLEKIRGTGTPAVIVAVYGNRAFEKAAVELARIASERGFVPVAAAAFVGEHSYSTASTPIAAGRPDDRDIADAVAFGTAVGRKLAAETPSTVDAGRLKEPRTSLLPLLRFVRFVVGYRRQQKRNPTVRVPAGDAERCTRCGRCVALCPTQAIARGDELRTDPARCIRCCACVKGCPFGARSYETPFAAALARSFGRRKPPVTLL